MLISGLGRERRNVARDALASQRSTTTSMSTHSLFGSLISETIASIDDLSPDELDKIANDCTVVAYDLVWNQGDYDQALIILQKALNIQRAYLGKYHKDVGYTCNFLGTTYWLQGKDLNKSMRYFLEARRIFCKMINNDSTACDTICTTSPLVSNIDDRIHFILLRFELPPEDIRRAKLAIERTIEHELRGDRLKMQGLLQEAKEEYKRARKVAGVLRQLM